MSDSIENPTTTENLETKKNTKTIKVKKKKKVNEIYSTSIINKEVVLNITEIDSSLEIILLNKIIKLIEGKCIEEGFVKPSSTNILSYSSGLINGDKIIFKVVIECLICYPVEGNIISCIVKNITKAGIKAELNDEYNPLLIFIARDHNYSNSSFSKLSIDEVINVRIIGFRYELNDNFISVIAQLYNNIN